MTEQEVTIALRYATHEQRQLVFDILRDVEIPSDTPDTTQRLYEAAGAVLGTKVGFNTRHSVQYIARLFVTAAYLRAGYNHAEIAKLMGINYQRITYYHRNVAEWEAFPYIFSHEISQLEQFLDIVNQKHIL